MIDRYTEIDALDLIAPIEDQEATDQALEAIESIENYYTRSLTTE